MTLVPYRRAIVPSGGSADELKQRLIEALRHKGRKL